MRRRPRRGARPGTGKALAAALTLVGLTSGLALTTLPTTPAAADTGTLDVEIEAVAPTILTEDDDLVIRGSVTNNGPETVEDPRLRLRLASPVLHSAELLDRWTSGAVWDSLISLTGWNQDLLTEPLEPGDSAPFRIELEDVSQTFGATWGPFGFAVEASGDRGQTTTEDRTVLVWHPEWVPNEVAPVEVATLVPLTPTPQEWQEAIDDQRPVGEVAAPRLLDVLDAIAGTAAIAVDAALLETLAPGMPPPRADDQTAEPNEPDEPSEETSQGSVAPDQQTGASATDTGTSEPTSPDSDPSEADSAQAELVERLARPDNSRDLIALGYADTVPQPLVDADGEQLWGDGQDRSAELFTGAGIVVEDVLWPAGDLDGDGVAMLADHGAGTLVLPTTAIATSVGVDARVPGTRGQTSANGVTVDLLLTDSDLSAALADDTPAVRSEQSLLAETVVTALTGSDALLLALPRDVDAEQAETATQRLQTIAQAPWLEPASIRSIIGRTGTPAPLLQLDATSAAFGLSQVQVERLVSDRGVIDAYAQAAGPEVLTHYLPGLLLPLSAAAATDQDLRHGVLQAEETAVAELASSVRVESGSSLLLISGSSSIPVTLSNDLTTSVTVQLELVPGTSRLQIDGVREIEIPAGMSVTERVPITAVANGDVQVAAHLLTPSGSQLSEPAPFTVRVRADWENIGTAIVAGLLAAAFVIGLIRTIRKGNSRARVR